jgi:hypothetical protein
LHPARASSTPFHQKKSHEHRAAASRGLHGLNVIYAYDQNQLRAPSWRQDLVVFYPKKTPVVKKKKAGEAAPAGDFSSSKTDFNRAAKSKSTE